MSLTGIASFVNNHLEFVANGAKTIVEPWGKDSFRVRTCPLDSFQKSDWALDITPESFEAKGEVLEDAGYIQNGRIIARIKNTRIQDALLSFYKLTDDGEVLLTAEKDYIAYANAAPTRRFKKTDFDLYEAELHFMAHRDEKIFGMGENETDQVNLKGCVIDLYQRHIKAPIPFFLSSLGYGFLWNNPSLGRAEFAGNHTRFVSYGCHQMDYFITTGDTYAEIMSHYIDAVGHASPYPYWASGFWQCKLRYKTEQEFLDTAHGFEERNLPLSVLVIDFLHWKNTGDWCFDEDCWPHPKEMVEEVNRMGARVMISPWTLQSHNSKNYKEMKEKGLLTASVGDAYDDVDFDGEMCAQYDPTNPAAADFMWSKWKESYVDRGITTFWLDPCDEFHTIEHYDKALFHIGPAKECHSMFVVAHQKNVFDRLHACGEHEVMNICRNAWVGSWRYGACPAPHDIESSFRHLKSYFKVGLNMMVSGTPYWNCDIGGFITDDNDSDEFHELMIRWYQWGVFMPIFRTHGHRDNNEPWTIGGNSYPYLRAQMLLREALRPYIMEQMKKAEETGLPPMRPLYFDYQDDAAAYDEEESLLFGSDLLAAAVLDYKVREREVYLPKGADWVDAYTGEQFRGGQTILREAPIGRIPVFVKADSEKREELLRIFADFLKELPQE